MIRFIAPMTIAVVMSMMGGAQAQSACEQQVLKDYDNPQLRLQFYQGAGSQASRNDAKLHLWRAQRSAELGDEAGCWDQRGWASYYVKPQTN
jgi:hypothetical protein